MSMGKSLFVHTHMQRNVTFYLMLKNNEDVFPFVQFCVSASRWRYHVECCQPFFFFFPPSKLFSDICWVP